MNTKVDEGKQWISVDDQMPAIGEFVFTIGHYHGKATNHCVAMLDDEGRFLIAYQLVGERFVQIAFEVFPSHWMPLPAPPAQGGSHE